MRFPPLLVCALARLIYLVSASEVPDGVVVIPLHRIKNNTAYGVELQIGTPPQTVFTSADTGSYTWGVESNINQVCKDGLCEENGTYDNTSSSSTTWISGAYFNHLNDQGFGSFVNDTVRVGGVTIDNMMFGVVEQNLAHFPIAGQQAAIFGLGPWCTDRSCTAYPSGFVQQLYDRGIIAKRVVSVYLGPNDPGSVGELVIGGIDRAKRQGTVWRRHVHDPLDEAAGIAVMVPIESLELHDDCHTLAKSNLTEQGYAIWDTGNPDFYMPTLVFNQVLEQFGLDPNKVDLNQPIIVDCDQVKQHKDHLTVSMGGGANISIPIPDLVVKTAEGNCRADIYPSEGVTLDDAFLRGVYFTFDFDNLTVEFAAAKFTHKRDIIRA